MVSLLRHEPKTPFLSTLSCSRHSVLEGIGDQQATWTALDETSTDTDETGGSNGTSNGDQLDLAVAQASLELIHIGTQVASADAFGFVVESLELQVRYVRLFLFVERHDEEYGREDEG